MSFLFLLLCAMNQRSPWHLVLKKPKSRMCHPWRCRHSLSLPFLDLFASLQLALFCWLVQHLRKIGGSTMASRLVSRSLRFSMDSPCGCLEKPMPRLARTSRASPSLAPPVHAMSKLDNTTNKIILSYYPHSMLAGDVASRHALL